MFKNIIKFKTTAEFKEWASANKHIPYMAMTEDSHRIHFRVGTQDWINKPFVTFIGGNVTATCTIGTFEYSTDKGNTWTSANSISWTSSSPDETFHVRATSAMGITFDAHTSDIIGNVQSLIDYNDMEATALNRSSAFRNLFKGCTADSWDIVIPYETINGAEACASMFQDSNINSTPALPAIMVSERCYDHMFQNCTSLIQAPELPATSTAVGCYQYMFENCTSLGVPPTYLASDNVHEFAYAGMFKGCSLITVTPEFHAINVDDFAMQSMFEDCTSLDTYNCTLHDTAPNAYERMFSGCTSLTTALATLPPVTTDACYDHMYSGCTSITTPSAFMSAPEIATGCFLSMYEDCTSLTTAPTLASTALEPFCYRSMFKGCTSLTAMPELPAESVPQNAYQSMFEGCSGLTATTEMAFTSFESGALIGMFKDCSNLAEITTSTPDWNTDDASNWVSGVSALGTFNNNGGAEIEVGVSGVPVDWTEVKPTRDLQFYADNDSFTMSIQNLPNNSSNIIEYKLGADPWRKVLNYGADYTVPAKTPFLVRINSEFTGDLESTTIQALSTTANVVLSGDWLSLSNGNVNTFKNRFANSTGLTEVICGIPSDSTSPSLLFTGTFDTCARLKKVTFPAFTKLTQLPEYFFANCFSYCSELTEANVPLPYTDLSKYCYSYMFANCTSLTTTPSFTASGNDHACERMFVQCSSLTSASNITLTGAVYPYQCDYMFWNCSNLTSPCKFSNILSIQDYGCRYMFNNCKKLSSYPCPSLPTILGKYACSTMFKNCNSLPSPPADFLPSTSLADRCYYSMFENTRFTSIPNLPATTLVTYCYYNMFKGCSNLNVDSSRTIKATRLATYSCYGMFQNCTSLSTIKGLFASIAVITLFPESCFYGIFSGCTKLTSLSGVDIGSTSSIAERYAFSTMFQNCTNLNTGPIFRPSTARDYSYNSCFANCKNLSTVYNLMVNGTVSTACNYWLTGVKSSGKLYAKASTSWPSGASGLPSGWTKVAY